MAIQGQARAGGPDEFAPSSAEIRQARKLAVSFRSAGGIPRAMQALCRDADRDKLPRNVAAVVLVERVAEAMPRLLDAIAALQVPGAEDRPGVMECRQAASDLIDDAVTLGSADDRYGVHGEYEREVADHRMAAQRALVGFLAKPGARRRAAISALSDALFRSSQLRGQQEPCFPGDSCWESGPPGLDELVTPVLVALLASKDDGLDALQLLVYLGVADPAVAAPAIRPYLSSRNSLPWAVLALTRMRQDMSREVAPLIDLLDDGDSAVALRALAAIGPGARAALPRLVTLAQRSACAPMGERVAITVTKIASPGDASVAAQAIAPLLQCETGRYVAAHALAQFGGDGHRVLLRYLREDDHRIPERLEIAEALERAGAKLDAGDRDTIGRLRAKQHRNQPESGAMSQVLPPDPPKPAPLAAASEELSFCRHEAGMAPAAVTGITDLQANALRSCLAFSLCGPSRDTLTHTLQRCCKEVFHSPGPAFCRP